ncbi:MAG: hypothetical protein JST68_20430 [Bacteroidetes bacterium]|nr:hypothetical protein [Bacteroidota bacterium]
MNTNLQKQAGIALIAFTILLVLTMVLHPVGGNVERLIRLSGMIIAVHSLAIFSLPFGGLGFWGLTRQLGKDQFLPLLAFIMACFGLVAAMLAASANGLIMPFFLQRYRDADPAMLDSIQPVLRYSFMINLAFDYVYTIAFSLAIGCWSVTILRTKLLASWLGWLGLAQVAAAIVTLAMGVAVNHLMGFRLFVTTVVIWLVFVGLDLYKRK